MNPKIVIGHFPIIDHLILGVAQKNDGGHFESFDLSTKLYVNWEKIATDFKNDKIDGAFLLFPLALELFQEGVKGKIVLLGQREGQAVVANKGVRSVADLKGKRVLIPDIFSVHNILLTIVLKRAGLDPLKDIVYKTGFNDVRDIPDMLGSGKVDATVAAEPWNTIAVKKGYGHIIGSSEDIKAHHVCCVLILRDEIIQKHPQACEELITSLVRAGMFVNAYPRQAAEIAETFIGCPKPIALSALTHGRGQAEFWDLLPRVEDFNDLQDVAVDEMHLWKKKLDLKKFIDADFADQAYRAWTVYERKSAKDKGQERTLPGNFREAAAHFASVFGKDILVGGVDIIKPGEKYPKDKEYEKTDKATFAILEEALEGKTYRVLSADKKAKAFVIYKTSQGRDPDFVFFRLDQSQKEKILSALQFGGAVNINFPISTGDEFLSFEKKIAIIQRGRDSWFYLRYSTFRVLPFLTSTMNS